MITAPLASIRARITRHAVDAALSDGADPTACAVIAARAAQLTGRAARQRTAEGLERLALTAGAPPPWPRISPSRPAIAANRETLLELAGLLRGERPLYARGLAMLELMLTDGTGPAYTDRHGEALHRQLELAHAGLIGALR